MEIKLDTLGQIDTGKYMGWYIWIKYYNTGKPQYGYLIIWSRANVFSDATKPDKTNEVLDIYAEDRASVEASLEAREMKVTWL